jgi:hypothetical protein
MRGLRMKEGKDMKLMKKHGYEGSIRKIANDEKTKVLGILGTVEDLVAEKVFDYCDADKELWACVTPDGNATFWKSKEEAVKKAEKL